MYKRGANFTRGVCPDERATLSAFSSATCAILDMITRTIVHTAMAMLASAAASAATCPGAAEKQVFWGDLHVHTSFSMDAYGFGARSDPAAAYRFAKGASRRLVDGTEHALARPLDFAAVTDHAENFDVMNLCTGEQADHEYCRAYEAASDVRSREGLRGLFTEFIDPTLRGEQPPVCPAQGVDCRAAQIDLWGRTIKAAEEANDPCTFTAFVANEWTFTPDQLHLHRNLIYANANVPRVPINSIDEPAAPAMWRALAARCTEAMNCDVLAIPHNPNLGMGGTFDIETLDEAELALRRRYERVMEIHQHKGQSECYPGGGFTDEACNFEIRLPKEVLTPEEQQQVASGYARAALARGLLRASRAGNPLRLGFIGSTDTHDARPGDVEESGWPGHVGAFDSNPTARFQLAANNPGGLAAVWATENTRAAIFAALKRRETYATSGPRIRLQIFATRDSADWCARDGMPDDAVVMGGTLPPSDAPPVFYVRALKDRTPLERVDIIKLTVSSGQAQQEIRTVSAGEAGASTLCLRHQDDLYNAVQPALWYARVLERATPRWRTETGDVSETVQERAWSSPIWSAAAR